MSRFLRRCKPLAAGSRPKPDRRNRASGEALLRTERHDTEEDAEGAGSSLVLLGVLRACLPQAGSAPARRVRIPATFLLVAQGDHDIHLEPELTAGRRGC